MASRARRKDATCITGKCPRGTQVECLEIVQNIEDCCVLLQQTKKVLFCEYVEGKNYHYWLQFHADTVPLVVCNLEGYAQKYCPQWEGRKSDYLLVGREKNECYIIVIELREQFTQQKQLSDKIEQLKQSIENITLHILPHLSRLQKFQEACFFETAQINYKIVGIAMPVVRSMRRVKQTKQPFSINNYEAQIVNIPQTCIKNCQLTWTDLLNELQNS